MSAPTLDAFREWLGTLGLSDGTIDGYASDAKLALEAGGFVPRLRDAELKPKTRHRILAAGRRWAEYADDDALAKDLRRFRLPPARRVAPKIPITRAQLFDVIDEIARADYLSAPVRAALGMMACRGFRCGDVLRIERHDLATAIASGVLAYEAKGRRWLQFKLLPTFEPHVRVLAQAPGEWTRVAELVRAATLGPADARPDRHPGKASRRRTAARLLEQALAEVGARCHITDLHPHRLRRTYAVEYLRSLGGDPEALLKLTEHMQWASANTAMEYVNHIRGAELDAAAERIFQR